MHQTVYATLDGCDAIRIAILVRAVGFGWATKVEAQFFHAMGMTYVNEKKNEIVKKLFHINRN